MLHPLKQLPVLQRIKFHAKGGCYSKDTMLESCLNFAQSCVVNQLVIRDMNHKYLYPTKASSTYPTSLPSQLPDFSSSLSSFPPPPPHTAFSPHLSHTHKVQFGLHISIWDKVQSLEHGKPTINHIAEGNWSSCFQWPSSLSVMQPVNPHCGVDQLDYLQVLCCQPHILWVHECNIPVMSWW